VNFGFRATVPHMIGIAVGFPIMLLTVGIGLGRLFVALPPLHAALKYICIAYLLYLSWRIATASAPRDDRRTARPLTFMQAAAFQWVNGKGWVVALSAVATYTVVDPTLPLQIGALSAISLIVTVASVCSWTLFGALLRQYLRTEARRRAFNYLMAALLVASIIPVLWEAA
jgi:threonine/homoserine/homoserine lactone efflux protein